MRAPVELLHYILFPAWLQIFLFFSSLLGNCCQILQIWFFSDYCPSNCCSKLCTLLICWRRRKPSRSQFTGLVKKSHMGSLASIVNPRTYHRSSSVSAAGSASLNGRPRSLHLPVTQTLSASSMISPVLSVATRAINNNNHLPCVEAGQLSSGSSLHLPYPPLIFPAAEFAPGNHVLQGRSPASNNAKGEPFSRVLDHFSLYSCVNALTWKLEKCPLLLFLPSPKAKNNGPTHAESQEMWKDLNSIEFVYWQTMDALKSTPHCLRIRIYIGNAFG